MQHSGGPSVVSRGDLGSIMALIVILLQLLVVVVCFFSSFHPSPLLWAQAGET